jgi:hypothetical protein
MPIVVTVEAPARVRQTPAARENAGPAIISASECSRLAGVSAAGASWRNPEPAQCAGEGSAAQPVVEPLSARRFPTGGAPLPSGAARRQRGASAEPSASLGRCTGNRRPAPEHRQKSLDCLNHKAEKLPAATELLRGPARVRIVLRAICRILQFPSLSQRIWSAIRSRKL